MTSFDLNIQAVLEDELYTTPPLMPVVVARLIGTKRDIPRAFKLTRDVSSVDLKHLRRIKDLPDGSIECIISRCDNQRDAEDYLNTLKAKFAQECIFENYRVAMVPKSAPRTDHQWRACTNIWPCKFAKSNYLIQCIEGSIFTNPEKLVISTIVHNVLKHIKNTSYTSGAVVFRCAKIHGLGFANETTVQQNPTKHSPMISIDSVSTNAGAGHWKCSDNSGVMKLIQDELDSREELSDHKIDANFLPYLCTNYDIFVTEEPCLMCTMGLVQSRIRRLFYLSSESLEQSSNCKHLCYPDKAIEKFLIHRDRNLNHRFEAWRITLDSDDGVL